MKLFLFLGWAYERNAAAVELRQRHVFAVNVIE